jgi:pimeloyl-ACP methyl ester carboxylesterase
MEIRNGDVTLYLEVDGDDDAPPVLLLHGITQSVETWGWFVPALVSHHRVLRLDFRGHGRSARTPGAYGMPGYVSDAVAVLEQVAGRPCVLIGHSLGGATASGVAQTRPDLVRAAVLEDAPLAAPSERVVDEDNSLLQGFRLMRDAIPRLQAGGIPRAKLLEVLARSSSSSGGTLGELVHDDAIEAMATAMMLLDASVLDPVLQGRFDRVFDPAQPLTVPTLAIGADPARPDAVCRPADLALLATAGPHVRTLTMAGAGHLVHDQRDQRTAFADTVLAFLRDLP